MTDSTAVPVVGIDLGTTFSLVAWVDATGRPATVMNAEGDLTTPSVVFFDKGGVVVGKEAVKAAEFEPERVAQFAKRDMGRVSFHKSIRGEPLPPEVIQALVLRKLRSDSELKLGPITKAVVTVPAYFDEPRRKATEDAGRLAGLDVLDILNEPTAAAISYGVQQGFVRLDGSKTERETVLVYDLGGGTFDVTLMEIDGHSFKALGTAGDVYLGGIDWTERIVDLVGEQFMAEHNVDPRIDDCALQNLTQQAEDAKRALTAREETTLMFAHEGQRLRMTITRAQFDEMTGELLDRTILTVRKVLREAKKEWKDVTRLLLVGGSSRMPAVQTALEKESGLKVDRSLSPDEAVAHGAAVYAALLAGNKTSGVSDISVSNVNSHDLGVLGVETATGRNRSRVMIPRNTQLPCKSRSRFKTFRDNQPSVVVNIVEGGDASGKGATNIGRCQVSPLPENLPKGTPVEVTFLYRSNGRIEVSAHLPTVGQKADLQIERASGLDDEKLKYWQGRIEEGLTDDALAQQPQPSVDSPVESPSEPAGEQLNAANPNADAVEPVAGAGKTQAPDSTLKPSSEPADVKKKTRLDPAQAKQSPKKSPTRPGKQTQPAVVAPAPVSSSTTATSSAAVAAVAQTDMVAAAVEPAPEVIAPASEVVTPAPVIEPPRVDPTPAPVSASDAQASTDAAAVLPVEVDVNGTAAAPGEPAGEQSPAASIDEAPGVESVPVPPGDVLPVIDTGIVESPAASAAASITTTETVDTIDSTAVPGVITPDETVEASKTAAIASDAQPITATVEPPGVTETDLDTDASEPDEDDEPAPAPAIDVDEEAPERSEEELKRLRKQALKVMAINVGLHALLLIILALIVIPASGGSEIFSIVTSMSDEPSEEIVDEVVIEQPDDIKQETKTEVVTDILTDTDDQFMVDVNDLAPSALETEPTDAAGEASVAPLKGEMAGRSKSGRKAMLTKYGGTAESEAAVAAGLAWLKRHQLPDGSWSFNHTTGECDGTCGQPGSLQMTNVAATGLALLAYMGAGSNYTDGEYQKTIERGLEYLVSQIKETEKGLDLRGNFEGNSGMYTHGIATICFCEAYALTDYAIKNTKASSKTIGVLPRRRVVAQWKQLRAISEGAVRFIVNSQNQQGGWRYTDTAADSDTSVVGWQVMGLASAHASKIQIPSSVHSGVTLFLDSVQSDAGGQYGYASPAPKDSTTAIGLLCRMYMGWNRKNPGLKRGVAYLSSKGPDFNNMYYNYYATQVMHHWGGDEWKKWNDVMRERLVKTQIKKGHGAGSWNIADTHGGGGGRLYMTCLATMTLEVYYRHLPLYDHLSEGGIAGK